MRLLTIIFFTATGILLAEDQPLDPYYQKLRDEFKEVGMARFVGGKTEKETFQDLQTGGGMEKFWRQGKKDKSFLTGMTEVSEQPFTQSSKLSLDTKQKVFWNAQFRIKNKVPINKGDSMLVVFWARGKKAPQIVDDGEGATLQVYLRSKGIGKFHKNRVSNFYDCKMLSEKWQRFYIKTGQLPNDFPVGKLSLVGMIGHKPQTVEVGGIAWMAFPKGANLAKMPKKSWNYEGRDPAAPWRKEAEQRIEKYRKGKLELKILDATDKPVAETDVKIRMKKHAFIFGTAVRLWAWNGKNEKNREKYRDISLKYFNSITTENCVKWQTYEKFRKNNFQAIKDMLKFYHDRGLNIRGHVLVWPSFHRTPENIKSKVKNDKELLQKAVNEHITELVNNCKPWVNDWDVTNETLVNRGYMDLLGPEAMVEWYKTAHAADPKVKLTLNEMSFGTKGGMELGSFPEKLLTDKCRGWVDYLIQHGAPLDYLGSQAHGGRVGKDFDGKTGPEGLWAYYDYLYKRYGKRLQLTELDVKIGDASDPDQLAYQADLLRDSIIIAFSHPAFEGITQWGFWGGNHYASNAALWTKDWQLRPNGKAYLDLVYGKWWTNADLKTDQQGKCNTEAFFGDYTINVGNKTQTISFNKNDKVKKIIIK